MKVTASQRGQITIWSVQGPIIEEDLAKIDAEMDNCERNGLKRIVLDLSQAPFIDSAGLEKMQAIALALGRRGGDLRIAQPNDVCRDILRTTRMESFVQVFDDREAAIRSLV